mgnify:CR=1 FL=1
METTHQRATRGYRTVLVGIALALGLFSIGVVAAQTPSEPWQYDRRLNEHPPLIDAVNEVFELAAAGDEAAFRDRFTENTVNRLERAWERRDYPGSWQTMMSALVARDGSPPGIAQVMIDDVDSPRKATVIVAIDGRQHALYMDRDPDRRYQWQVEVRELGLDIFDPESLNISVGLAQEQTSIAEISFGTGLATPARYLYRFDDNVQPTLTTSLWIMGELFIRQWVHVGVIYDIPLGLQVLQVDGEIVNEFVPSRLFGGITWTPLQADFGTESRLEIQILTYVGSTVEEPPELAPLIATRAVLLQNPYEGADLYLGVYYQGAIDVIGILYGVGYRF